MRRNGLVALLAVLAVVPASAAAAPTRPAPATAPAEAMSAAPLAGGARRPPAGWVRFLDEDFSTPLARGRWNRCFWWADGGCTIASNGELQWYRPANTRVANGRLRLQARREAVTAPSGQPYEFSSGMATTGPPSFRTPSKLAFRYGYVEARLRLPVGRGLWPAFWLLPARHAWSEQSRPEIDVLEVLGHDPTRARFHYHYVDRGGRRRSLGHSWAGPADLSAGFHRFAVDWRPGSLTWIVDGRARWRVTGASVPNERMYLLFTLAVGGDYPGPPDEATAFPADLVVDWVRVWRHPAWRA